MSNSMFDQYLVFQALGLDWNIWNIILFDAVAFVIFLLVVGCCAVIVSDSR